MAGPLQLDVCGLQANGPPSRASGAGAAPQVVPARGVAELREGCRRTRRPAPGGPRAPRRVVACEPHAVAPGASWPRRSRSARDHDGDDGVAAGRLVIDEEHDGPPIGRKLDRPRDDAVRRELGGRAPGIGSPSRRSPTRSLVGLTVQARREERLEGAVAEHPGVRAGEHAQRLRPETHAGCGGAGPARRRDGRGPPRPRDDRRPAAAVRRARRSRPRAPSSASRGRAGRRCRPGPRGTRGHRVAASSARMSPARSVTVEPGTTRSPVPTTVPPSSRRARA